MNGRWGVRRFRLTYGGSKRTIGDSLVVDTGLTDNLAIAAI
jgi:hypothetical protein